jgi:8-oxo-dGTP pyrophosphatase MutT (NUDIX family)
LKAWSMPARTRVGSFRIFDVDRREVRDGGGGARRDVFTIQSPDWCNVVALTEDDEVVLAWQYRFGTGAMSLEIPGGVLDAGEAPDEAARRELLEETGYAVAPESPLEPLLVVEANPAIQNNRCHTFLCRGAKRVAAPSFDENEELEVVLVPAKNVAELLDGEHVTHALVRAALEVFLRKRGG